MFILLSAALINVLLKMEACQLTYDAEPQQRPMHLRHDDAHHVSDRLRLHDCKGEVRFIESDRLGGWWRTTYPLNMKSSGGCFWGAALIRGVDLEQYTKSFFLKQIILEFMLWCVS